MRILPVILFACSLATSFARDKVLEHRPIEPTYTQEQFRGISPLLTVTKKISSEGPTLTFKLFQLSPLPPVPTTSNRYRLDVCSEDGSRTIQQLGEFGNAIAVEYRRDSFQILDIDADGFSDIRLLAGFDKSGRYDKPWYKYWVYQPQTQSFVFKPNKGQ